ncbi:glycosyltransferase family 2 protein [Salana multivorans]
MTTVPLPAVPVTVAILTYQRPAMLRTALEAVSEQASALSCPIELLVVDNDPRATAEDVVVSLEADVPVRYVCEPTPGIAAARNAALVAARDSRLLVFVDDDEVPEPEWLARLLGHWEQTRCAAVAGPVLSRLPDPVPDPWVVASGIFDRARFPTGSRRPGAGAGNLLLDLQFVRRHQLAFDARLGLQGGEDTLLTHEIVARGGFIEWCDEAVATELVPPERVTRSWMRRRAFRSGSSWARATIAVAPGRGQRLRARVTVAGRSIALLLLNAAGAAVAVLRRDRDQSARRMRAVYAQAGAGSGLTGRQVSDYRRG